MKRLFKIALIFGVIGFFQLSASNVKPVSVEDKVENCKDVISFSITETSLEVGVLDLKQDRFELLSTVDLNSLEVVILNKRATTGVHLINNVYMVVVKDRGREAIITLPNRRIHKQKVNKVQKDTIVKRLNLGIRI